MRLLLVVLLAAGVAALVVNHQRARAAEAELGEVAAELVGRDVSVDCQGLFRAALDVTSDAGTVEFDAGGQPSDTTELKRGVCARLRSLDRDVLKPEFECVLRGEDCEADVMRSVWAVHTLAHEAWHLAGIRSEADAECRALQSTAWTAVRLGAPNDRAQAIAVYVARHMYPGLPENYRSPQCRNGGALDLRPGTAFWP